MTSSLLLLDACCAINLLASGKAAEVLGAIQNDVGVARLVLEQEVLHLGVEVDPEVGGRKVVVVEEISLWPLVEAGALSVLEPSSEEEFATYVSLAVELDDGEAMTGAIAVHRQALVATDDKKALRVLGNVLPQASLVRTSALLKEWADQGVPTEVVREALRSIEHRASFRPPRSDPLRAWWDGKLGGA